ncbi:MAG: hypothetical protein AAGJ56_04585 [Myxococcota bacterium]
MKRVFVVLLAIVACAEEPSESKLVPSGVVVEPVLGGQFWPADCDACLDRWSTCQDSCASDDGRSGTHACGGCDTEFEQCWKKNECEQLDPDCDDCIEEEQKCVLECEAAEDRDVCVATCESAGEFCWQSQDCDGPYADETAVCNYLERGIDDFMQFGTDRYTVLPPGITTLSDVEKLEFGLDLPLTNCVDNPSSIPCADKSYNTEWSIDAVTMEVNGVELFREQKSEDKPFLIQMTGGKSSAGISGWDSSELRSNASWGLSEQDALEMAAALPLPNAGVEPTRDDFIAAVGAPEIEANDLQAMLESAFGRVIARDIKEGANSDDACTGKTYCDNARGFRYAWRQTHHDSSPNCDFGDCPSAAERRSSPWVETRRLEQGGPDDQDFLQVSADLEVIRGKADPSDCPFGDLVCGEPNGTKYSWWADADVTLTLEPVCVDGPGNTHSIRLEARDVAIAIEDGNLLVDLGEPLVDALCGLWGWVSNGDSCSFVGLFSGSVEDDIKNALTKQTFIDDLENCPEPVVAELDADGGLKLAIDTPQNSTGREMASDQWVRWARIGAEPGAAQSSFEMASGTHVAATTITNPLDNAVVQAITGADAPTEKQSMARLDGAQAGICALLATYEADLDDDGADEEYFVCDPDIDLDVVALPPPRVTAAVAFSCDSTIPQGADADNDAACEELAQLKAFVMQPEIYDRCVLYNADGNPPDLALPVIWEQFEEVLATCADALPPVETLIPVPSVELVIANGRKPASDTFAFVDFSEAGSVKESDHDEFSCRNRLNLVLTPDPETYDECPDPDSPSSQGFAGCPCADLDDSDFMAEGGFPDGPGSYLANGSNGPGQYCRDDGSEVVCGRVEKPSRSYPKCMECGVDTALGCSCEVTSDCQGFEDNLRCVGSASEEGWLGGGAGTCLPDPGTHDGREAIEEMPWFCLDNCGAIDGYAGTVGGCYYRRTGPLVTQHATCINPLFTCLDTVAGVCEIEEGMMCKDGGDGPDVCEQECLFDSDCQELGFPAHYVCDSATYAPAHCVPPDCLNPGSHPLFCSFYR